MSSYADRLKALREQLKADRLDGFVVPLTDEHMSEYVGSYAQRLAWLTGFEGSAGSAAVLPQEAAIFVDGRYTLQVRSQVDGKDWSYQSVPETSVADWLKEHAPQGGRIGYDPWLHSRDWVKRATEALAARGAELVAVEQNPIDKVWADRPEASKAHLAVQAEKYTGRSSADKRQEIADWLTEQGADAAVLSALEFDRVGVQRSRSGRVADARRPGICAGAVGRHRRPLREPGEDQCRGSAASRQWRAPARSQRVRGGTRRAERPDRCGRSGAGGRGDLRGARQGGREDHPGPRPDHPSEGDQERRGDCRPEVGAISRRRGDFPLPALGRDRGAKGRCRRAQGFGSSARRLRREDPELRDLSFDSISGAGPNGAIVHYRSSEKTNRKLETGTLYLIDSGGQYLDGTTDITRTVAIGEPTDEMRDRFTRVLKGHIAVATAIFPKGTRGTQLDSFARRPLWEAGLDYAHGTGHGVGSFLSVHEGPQRISPAGSAQAGGDEPLRAGMILSNEPGYYKTGAYGIRIENLVLVVDKPVEGAEKETLGFETLTFAPIERRLVDVSMLSDSELKWLNDYHADVLAKIGPRLEGEDKAWLERQCAPLSR